MLLERHFGNNQSRMARETGVHRQKLLRSLSADVSKPDTELLDALSRKGGFRFEWLISGQEPLMDRDAEVPSGRVAEPARSPVIQSNAEFVDLGKDSIWVPIYPVYLGAGDDGDVSIEDLEPEGAFPLPASFARQLGINGHRKPFGVTVRGDSMNRDFPDGAMVFGYMVPEVDGEDIYALYLGGELLVKRVRRKLGGGYELISSNPSYPPVPVATDDVRVIGVIKGALTTV